MFWCRTKNIPISLYCAGVTWLVWLGAYALVISLYKIHCMLSFLQNLYSLLKMMTLEHLRWLCYGLVQWKYIRIILYTSQLQWIKLGPFLSEFIHIFHRTFHSKTTMFLRQFSLETCSGCPRSPSCGSCLWAALPYARRWRAGFVVGPPRGLVCVLLC